jgi:hypothetical protein
VQGSCDLKQKIRQPSSEWNMETQIHAGFCVETGDAIVGIDPWLRMRAFGSASFQFPRNHHLMPLVIERPGNPERKRFVSVCHERRDHPDQSFRSRIDSQNLTFLCGVAGGQRSERYCPITTPSRQVLQVGVVLYICSRSAWKENVNIRAGAPIR